MKDQFDRTIDYIRISVTDRCNLRCRYCMPPEGIEPVAHREILTFDEIVRLTEQFAECGIRKVKITGGEPLVRRGVVDLIRDIRAVKGIEEVTLTTNGVRIGQQPQLARQLAEAGISSINISLDTLKRERYETLTGTDCLEDVLRAIDVCCSIPDLRVKVNVVTLAEFNWDEVADLVWLAHDRDLDVRFIELMPVGRGKQYGAYSQDWILKQLAREYGPAAAEQAQRGTDGQAPGGQTAPEQAQQGHHQKTKAGNGPAVYYRLEGFRGRVGFISALSHQFCGECNRVRLTSEGLLKPCLQYGGGTDLRTLLRDGAGDEVLREAIRQTIWSKPRQHHFTDEAPEGAEEKNMSFIGG